MELNITIDDPDTRGALFGPADSNLRLIRAALDVRISARDSQVHIRGPADSVGRAAAVMQELQQRVQSGARIDADVVAEALADAAQARNRPSGVRIDVYLPGTVIAPRTEGQRTYIESIRECDLTICVGPAGTGKTYLAVAMSLALLKRGSIKRIVLVRPAVEAGEKLGYLPGDLQAKVNPYLRPLFDAMNDMMSFDQLKRFMQSDVIEVVPLAFMRGRTLNKAVVILDEAQNTTSAQMLMFLTRLGHYSKMIVTGDDSQVDLAPGQHSGLIDAVGRLRNVAGVRIVRLAQIDIVRHHLVQAVVEAYGNETSVGRARRPSTADADAGPSPTERDADDAAIRE